MLYVAEIYKKGNKPVCYTVIFDDGSMNTVAYKTLFEEGKRGNISNMYIRNGTLVLKRKYGVRILEYRGTVRVVHLPCHISCKTPLLFDLNIKPCMLDNVCLQAIYKIDNATPERDVTTYGKFSTPNGVCSMSELSSGCKSVIYAYLIGKERETVIDVTSMGINALLCLFDILSKHKDNKSILGIKGLPILYNNELDGYICKDVDNGVACGLVDFLMHYV